MVSVILGSSYHGDICPRVHFLDKFGFNYLFDAMKRGCDVMIDSCDWLANVSDRCMGGNLILQLHFLMTTAQTLALNEPAQHGGTWIWDILASFLYIWRKWRLLFNFYTVYDTDSYFRIIQTRFLLTYRDICLKKLWLCSCKSFP